MSNYWDLYCETCAKACGIHWNHGEDRLSAFLTSGGLEIVAPLLTVREKLGSIREKLGPCDVSLSLSFEFGPEFRVDLIEFCAAHRDHEVVVRSEYGYNLTDCAESYYCPTRQTRRTCRLLKGHPGEHYEKATRPVHA